MHKFSRYENEIAHLKSQSNLRQLQHTDQALYDLCSNDYLGLNQDEKLYAGFQEKHFPKMPGFSSSASRLLSSNDALHQNLEQYIAHMYQKEAALLFNSGYHANTGILSTLPGKNDLIVADKWVHASVIDGAKLSPAHFVRYRHLDYAHLKKLVEKHRHQHEHVFIVSESIFSMDGDVANIRELADIKKQYNCFLCIDEAHGLGTRGKLGLGCAEEQGCLKDVDLVMGALGKAMASVGAFVACSGIFKEYLINHARSFIFSTGLPPINVAWSQYVLERLPDFHVQRKNLSRISHQFSELMGKKVKSHIIPYIVGKNETALTLSQALKENGYKALPIRYPTVPRNTARLRFSVCAHMDMDELFPIKNIIQKHEPVLDTAQK